MYEILLTQNRELQSVIRHFSFRCHGNRFYVNGDEIPFFNSKNLGKTADFEVPPSVISGAVDETICITPRYLCIYEIC